MDDTRLTRAVAFGGIALAGLALAQWTVAPRPVPAPLALDARQRCMEVASPRPGAFHLHAFDACVAAMLRHGKA